MTPDGYRVAVVGATGVVGSTIREILRERAFPAAELAAFASARSSGRELEDGLVVRELTDEAIAGFDLALFSAGAGVSREWAPRFAAEGAVVIDNSSAFRGDLEIPLVVSEVNPQELDGHRGIVANPNCSTMQMMVALKPLHDRAGIERLVVSTYQAVSGTGQAAIDELLDQSHAILHEIEPPSAQVYPKQIAFNVIGGAGNFVDGDDHTDEERKMMWETRRILGDADIGVSVTCARVPVVNGHSESVNVQTREPLAAADARELLARAPGVSVLDEPAVHAHPSALDADGSDDVWVGRIRQDASHPRALNLWIVGDNLRKGAALNAVQIAELLHARGLLGARREGAAPAARR
ncbi:MAG: aspartate-semialdehyde dehydrogenase [Actinomycetota bacterium]|nr:aspartate-semialdehyde dehydrogenase [Actinomycetota bacterium]